MDEACSGIGGGGLVREALCAVKVRGGEWSVGVGKWLGRMK